MAKKYLLVMVAFVIAPMLGAATADARPLAPSNLMAHALSSSAISLDWTEGDVDVTGFVIERSPKAKGGFRRITEIDGTSRSYQDEGLTSATAYYYRMKALKGRSKSKRSAVVAGTTESIETADATPAVTATPVATETAFPTAVASAPPHLPIPPATSTAIATAAPTQTAARTATPIVTATPIPTATVTMVPTVTATTTPIRTATVTATSTPVPTQTSQPTAVASPTADSGEVTWQVGHGGSGFDLGYGVAVDGDSNVVVTGTFTDTANFGTGALHSAGAGDIFVAKYTAAGAPVWSKRFGSADADIGYSVAVDKSANCDGSGGTDCIVIAGLFSDSVNFGGAPLTSAGMYDIFLAKFSAAGTHLWSKRFGNAYEDVAYGVATDANGNIVLTGFFSNTTDFGGGTLYSQYYNRDVFVAKFAPTGAHVWSKNFWTTSSDVGQAVAIDVNGDIAVTGFFTGAIDLGTGRLNSRKDDIFVAKLAGADGHAVWARSFGGTDVDRGMGVAFDHSTNVIVTGLIYNGTIDFGGGPLTTGYNQDGFVVKLTSAAGAHVWSKLIGGTGSDAGLSVTADASDNVIVSGYFQDEVEFGDEILTSAGNASADIFVVSYSATGSYRSAQAFGGASGDGWQGGHITTDDATNEVVVTSSFEAVADFDGVALTSAGSDDVCVVKLQP